MKHADVKNHIGERIRLNGACDLAMDANLKPLVLDKEGYYDIRIRKITKSGLIQIAVDGKYYTVPSKNIDLYLDSST